MAKLFVNSIEGLTTETDFDIYFAPKNGQRANELNIGRPSKRLKKELNIVQDMLSVLVNRPIRAYDVDTVYQYGELVQVTDQAGDAEYIEFWQSQIDNNLAVHPHFDENANGVYWKQYEPFGTYPAEQLGADYKNDVKFGFNMHNSGYFIVGERRGRNISIDRDEISARIFNLNTNEVHSSLLRIQPNGGMLTIHGNLWEVTSERHRVSTFTDDGRFILGNKETVNNDVDPHPFDKCYKFECWGDALITQEARFGGWVSFDKGFSKVPSITVQDGVDTSLSDRLVIEPNETTGNVELNSLQPLLDKGSTMFVQNHPSQTGDLIINSGPNTVHITNEGRMGIKKLAPEFALDVNGQVASNSGSASAVKVINQTSSLVINTCTNRAFYINAYAGEDPECLHIQNAGGDTYFNCTDNIVHITSTGRVGIGVENPTCALDVMGNAVFNGTTSALSGTFLNATKKLRFETVAGSDDYRIFTAANDGGTSTLYLQDNLFSDVVINGKDSACIAARKTIHFTEDGNAGIGTANPAKKLVVAGDSEFRDHMYVSHPAGAGGTAIETNGRIRAVYFDGLAAGVYHADIAERYESDIVYEMGTILSIGGDKEVTLAQANMPLAGIVSVNPGFKMNDSEENYRDDMPFIALKGRVPCKVSGHVKKGQYVVVDKDGMGKGVDTPTNPLIIVGVALSDSEGEYVEVKV